MSPNPGFSTAAQPLHMMFGGEEAVAAATGLTEVLTASSNAFLVATVDQDIAKLSDNEFAPIFAGGILVMFGGIMSALIVGFILESNNSYANVIADSYAQSEDDEEFWKGLSDEEANKTRELLQKLRDSKEGKKSGSSAEPAVAATAVLEAPASRAPMADAPQEVEEKKAGDMFSDY